jgi:hypothetical protein
MKHHTQNTTQNTTQPNAELASNTGHDGTQARESIEASQTAAASYALNTHNKTAHSFQGQTSAVGCQLHHKLGLAAICAHPHPCKQKHRGKGV